MVRFVFYGLFWDKFYDCHKANFFYFSKFFELVDNFNLKKGCFFTSFKGQI